MPAIISALPGKFARSLRTRGALGTAAHMFITARYRWDTYRERRFDVKWGVETSGYVPLPRHVGNPAYELGERSEPVAQRVFHRLLRAVRADKTGFHFFDMGCGKGRALLLASQYPFRAITGVELVPDLAAIAERNIRLYRTCTRKCADVRVFCGNAADYEFPDENAIIFFYNPFKEEIMRRVLEQVRRSARNTTERYILYVNPVCAPALLDGSSSFSLVAKDGEKAPNLLAWAAYKLVSDHVSR